MTSSNPAPRSPRSTLHAPPCCFPFQHSSPLPPPPPVQPVTCNLHPVTNPLHPVTRPPRSPLFPFSAFQHFSVSAFQLFSLPLLPLLASLSAHAAALVVDPPAALTNYWTVDWNTDGNFQGWTTSQITNTSVSAGLLQGNASGTDPQLQALNFAAGPDLDLGYNDQLELRLQAPATYAGTIQLFYGVTNTPGISSTRVVTIANTQIPKDGLFHTYRLDMGLEPYWRGTLRDLRLDPLEGASALGQPFALDYLRVGDLPGDVYYPNTTDQPVTPYELSSKHFRFIWDAAHVTNNGMNATWAHGNLRNAEETWQLYVNYLHYREPAESTDLARRDGKKYKVNFLCTYDGYWMGGSPTSFGYFNVEPSGLRVDPPGWVIPHELMHVFQMHQGGSMPGEWWEGHANYGREQWIYFYDEFFPNQSGIDAFALTCAHQLIASGRDYYLTWPFFLYLDENPDHLPDLAPDFMARVWQSNPDGVYPYTTIDQLTPTSSVKDLVGLYARRMLTLDFSHQQAITNALNGQNPTVWRRYQRTELLRRSDDTNWWRVPPEMAPMEGAYAIHELVPSPASDSRIVSVNLHGLPDPARGADWRASFIVVSNNGAVRYSPLWNGGSSSVTLAPTETALFLAVAGTPNSFVYGGHDDLAYPYRSHPSKQRFHYELQVFGATPRESNNGGTSGLLQHANGGGWKASSAIVDPTAYIGPNARVLESARVRNYARIEDFAVVRGSAQVLNSAVVSGHALVWDSAVIKENAKVRDWAIVGGSAVVAGQARVIERPRINDGVVTNFAVAKGTAVSQGGLALSGYGIIDGDFMGGRSVSNGVAFGHQPYVGVPDSWVRLMPDRLFVAYEFEAANDSMLRDSYGATDAWLHGAPQWLARDGRMGVLRFRGTNDYVELDKSLCDLKDFTLSTWLKWDGGPANQPIWHFGSATNRAMWLTPSDANGQLRFVLRSNSLEQAVAASFPLATGQWVNVTVTLSNTTCCLYVNASLAGQGTLSVTPDQLLAGNTNAAPQHHYLARAADPAQPFFSGALDSFRVYSRALTQDELQTTIVPPPTAGTLYVDLRASDPSAATATWTNYGSLGHFTRVGTPTLLTNVLNTGIPGLQFSGSGQAYQGPNSLPDIDGAGDRSVEVWAFNPSLAAEETMVSWGHRGTTRRNFGFNFGNNTSWGAATHYDDDAGWGASPPSANAWHHLVYTYSGTLVNLYVDGTFKNSKTLAAPLDTFPGEPVNLGCQRDSANGTRSFYFSGYLNSVRVHGGVLSPEQVLNNYLAGPAMLNLPPTLAPIPDQTLIAGATLLITNSASDPNLPAQTLTWSLLTPPPGAQINPTNALLSWRPTLAQSSQRYSLRVRVADDGLPSLSATQAFWVTVNRPLTPTLAVPSPASPFQLQFTGEPGPDYIIQASTNLLDWSSLTTNTPATFPCLWTDPDAPLFPQRFYRILLGP